MRTPRLLAAACTAADPDAPYRHAELAIWDEVSRSLTEYPHIWRSAGRARWSWVRRSTSCGMRFGATRSGCARAEATQVGAMAVRFIADIYEPSGSARQRCRTAAAEQHAVRSAVVPRVGSRRRATRRSASSSASTTLCGPRSASGADARAAAGRVAAMALRFIAEITSAATVVGAVR